MLWMGQRVAFAGGCATFVGGGSLHPGAGVGDGERARVGWGWGFILSDLLFFKHPLCAAHQRFAIRGSEKIKLDKSHPPKPNIPFKVTSK